MRSELFLRGGASEASTTCRVCADQSEEIILESHRNSKPNDFSLIDLPFASVTQVC